MTETCAASIMEHPLIGARNSGSAGSLLSGAEAKITSVDTGKALRPNELGEICFRGPSIMKGNNFSWFVVSISKMEILGI